jgi:hypothetical protein
MPAGPTLSGTNGKFLFTPSGGAETELELGKWGFNGEVDTDRYATSKSGGFKMTEPGNKAATFNIEGKRVTDAGKVEAVLTGLGVGVKGTAKLGFDASTGISVPCVVKNLSYEVDINAGTVESFSATCESNGAWSYY